MTCLKCGSQVEDLIDGLCYPCYAATHRLCTYDKCFNRKPKRGGRLCTSHWYQMHRGKELSPITPKGERTKIVAMEASMLIGSDTADSIARRLGYSGKKSLARVLHRAKWHDLACQIERKAA